ncbi:unnamed protein product [Meganyctiphanes norvegica]|uniref:SH2 domain-containing protein n=1 Tax=Meganyctiphanes norvegica TaxID=48144 RepID=A0AAV2PJA7_MEGNR
MNQLDGNGDEEVEYLTYGEEEDDDEDDQEYYGNHDTLVMEHIKKGENYETAVLKTIRELSIRPSTEDDDSDFSDDGSEYHPNTDPRRHQHHPITVINHQTLTHGKPNQIGHKYPPQRMVNPVQNGYCQDDHIDESSRPLPPIPRPRLDRNSNITAVKPLSSPYIPEITTQSSGNSRFQETYSLSTRTQSLHPVNQMVPGESQLISSASRPLSQNGPSLPEKLKPRPNSNTNKIPSSLPPPPPFRGPPLPSLPQSHNNMHSSVAVPPHLSQNKSRSSVPTIPSFHSSIDNAPSSVAPPIRPHSSVNSDISSIATPIQPHLSQNRTHSSVAPTPPFHSSIGNAPPSSAPPLPPHSSVNSARSSNVPPLPPSAVAPPIPPSIANRSSIAPQPPPPSSAAPPLPPHAVRRDLSSQSTPLLSMNRPPLSAVPPIPQSVNSFQQAPLGGPPPLPPHAEAHRASQASPNPTTTSGNLERMNIGEGESLEITPLYRSIIDANYFHGITRNRSRTILEDLGDGTFLIRPSTRPGNPLALCVRCNRNTYNISIRERHDGRLSMGLAKDGERTFGTVDEIVSCFRQEPIRLENGRQVILATTPPKTDNIYVCMPYYT